MAVALFAISAENRGRIVKRNSPVVAAGAILGDLSPKSALPHTVVAQTLVLDAFPPPAISRALSPNGRAHWAAKKRARERVEMIVGAAIITQRLTDELCGGRVRITYRWIFPDRRKRDLDNHSTGVVKVVQDCLVRLGMIDADDTSCVVGLNTEVVYEKGRRALEIVIEPAGEV